MSASAKSANRQLGRILILPILLLAFALRIYRVGSNSFWLDEVYQMIAATQPTVSAMMLVISHYTMSLPLDYLVSWVVSRLDTSEAVMRFPAVVWGELAIVVCYVVAKRLSGNTGIGLASALWLTLLSQHIHYSQELRFYASLSVFYVLSTYLLIRSLEHPGWKNWVIFVALTAVGIYFHPFVVMAGLNGVAWLLISNRVPTSQRRSGWVFLVLAGVVLGLAFVPGYLSNQVVEYFPLLFWGVPIEQSIAIGLGWTWTISGLLYLGFVAVGAAGAIYYRDRALIAFLVALVAQVAVVIAADWLKGFWFANRQLVHLLVLAALFAGCGTVYIANGLSAFTISRKLARPFVVLLVVALALPALQDYYAWPKSNGREIADQLIQRASSTDTAFVIPGYNAKVVVYYLHRVGVVQLDERVISSDWSTLAADMHKPVAGGRTYLITQAVLSQEQQSLIATLGFTVRLDHDPDLPGAQALYVRTP